MYLHILICWAVLSLSGLAAATGGNGPPSRPAVLNVGYPQSAFSEVDIKDAQAVLQIWTKQMLARETFPIQSKVTIYPDEASLIKAIQANEVNLASISATRYLELKDKLPVEPLFVPTNKGRVGDEYLLLVHRQSGIAAINQLKNRKIMIYPSIVPDSAHIIWLNALLQSQGLPVMERFFGTLNLSANPSQAILPVFFRQTDACFIPRRNFETVVELNPQVGADLQILVQSPPLLRGLLVWRTDLDGRLKEVVKKSLAVMHSEPQGKQILTLIRYDRLIPFQSGYLDSLIKRVNQTGKPGTKQQSQ